MNCPYLSNRIKAIIFNRRSLYYSGTTAIPKPHQGLVRLLWYWGFQLVSSVWCGSEVWFRKSWLYRLLYIGFLRREPCIFWFWQLLCRISSERNDFRSIPLSFFAFCCWQRCQLFLLLPFYVSYLYIEWTKPWRFYVGVPRSITALVCGGYVWIRGFFLTDG